MKKYDYWLCSIAGVGNCSIKRLLSVYGNAKEIYEAGEKGLAEHLRDRQLQSLRESRRLWDVEGEYAKMQQAGIGFLTKGEEGYPKRLQRIPDAPYGIFYRGRLPREERMAAAIVGARDCSEYGRYVAAELGKYFGRMGVQVISGMARGIDGISQESALNAGGFTAAVLGCGVDICYPRQNQALYEKILQQGGVLSSYAPGTLPKPQNFPPRNRIVSGLADVLVVIEARNKSGTLITVDMALEQGKEVYVVPGRITDRLSDGCNRLLKQGAGILLSPEEFLEEIGGIWKAQKQVQKKEDREKGREEEKLPENLQKIYQVLDFTPQSTEKILEQLEQDIPVSELNVKLMKLCLLGRAGQETAGHFYRLS